MPRSSGRNAGIGREALQHNVRQSVQPDEKERNQDTQSMGILWRNRYPCWVLAKGGRKFALTKVQARLAQAAMSNRDTSVAELCGELRIKPMTLYRYVGPDGELRKHGKQVLSAWRRISPPAANDPGKGSSDSSGRWTRNCSPTSPGKRGSHRNDLSMAPRTACLGQEIEACNLTPGRRPRTTATPRVP